MKNLHSHLELRPTPGFWPKIQNDTQWISETAGLSTNICMRFIFNSFLQNALFFFYYLVHFNVDFTNSTSTFAKEMSTVWQWLVRAIWKQVLNIVYNPLYVTLCIHHVRICFFYFVFFFNFKIIQYRTVPYSTYVPVRTYALCDKLKMPLRMSLARTEFVPYGSEARVRITFIRIAIEYAMHTMLKFNCSERQQPSMPIAHESPQRMRPPPLSSPFSYTYPWLIDLRHITESFLTHFQLICKILRFAKYFTIYMYTDLGISSNILLHTLFTVFSHKLIWFIFLLSGKRNHWMQIYFVAGCTYLWIANTWIICTCW